MNNSMGYCALFGSMIAVAAISGAVSRRTRAGGLCRAGAEHDRCQRLRRRQAVKEIAALLPAGTKTLTVAMNLSTPPNKFLGPDGRTASAPTRILPGSLGGSLGVPVKFANVTFDGHHSRPAERTVRLFDCQHGRDA